MPTPIWHPDGLAAPPHRLTQATARVRPGFPLRAAPPRAAVGPVGVPFPKTANLSPTFPGLPAALAALLLASPRGTVDESLLAVAGGAQPALPRR